MAITPLFAPLGHTMVQVEVDKTTRNGHFSTWEPNSNTVPTLRIGIADISWWRCKAVLFHEALELLTVFYSVRYEKSGTAANNAAEYYFFFDHQEFAELCAQLAYFIDKIEPGLKKLWAANQKKGKR